MAERRKAEQELKNKKMQLQRHIEVLHHYNEVKDVGQMLLGKAAEVEGMTVSDMYEKFGLQFED